MTETILSTRDLTRDFGGNLGGFFWVILTLTVPKSLAELERIYHAIFRNPVLVLEYMTS